MKLPITALSELNAGLGLSVHVVCIWSLTQRTETLTIAFGLRLVKVQRYKKKKHGNTAGYKITNDTSQN